MFKAVLVLVVALFAGAVVAFLWIDARGISAKADPGRIETAVARTMRRLAIPRDARDRRNPVTLTPDVLAEGMAHYADHCASCHANDGSGDTQVGRGLYPKSPDMRSADTQNLSDGELFYIIENGVRLTGMPAWSTGTPEGEESSWHLVHFIRHLPKLTAEEIERMAALNPTSREQLRQEEEERKFLEGSEPAPTPSTPAPPHVH
jgi:mono/diheme cytochrome c family protein